MTILEKLLSKLGASSYLELNDEERATYRSWEESLQGRRLTDEDVATFLTTEYNDAVTKVTKMRLGDKDDTFLKMKIDFITAIRKFLDTPAIEKKMTEASIEQMLK